MKFNKYELRIIFIIFIISTLSICLFDKVILISLIVSILMSNIFIKLLKALI